MNCCQQPSYIIVIILNYSNNSNNNNNYVNNNNNNNKNKINNNNNYTFPTKLLKQQHERTSRRQHAVSTAKHLVWLVTISLPLLLLNDSEAVRSIARS
jgi:hypothetical protein